MSRLRPHCRVYLTALADRLSAGESVQDAEQGARRDQRAAGHPPPARTPDANTGDFGAEEVPPAHTPHGAEG